MESRCLLEVTLFLSMLKTNPKPKKKLEHTKRIKLKLVEACFIILTPKKIYFQYILKFGVCQ